MSNLFDTKDNLVEQMKLNSAMNNRTIYMTEVFNSDSCFKLNYFLDRFVRLDEKENKKEPITIVISSVGGLVYEALSNVSRIEKMKEDGYEIITIIDGYAMSCGSLLAQCGSKRYARRYSTILYHQVSGGSRGTVAEMQVDMAESERLWELMKTITLKHTKFTEEELDEIHRTNRDYFFTPEQCLEKGIIDEIL